MNFNEDSQSHLYEENYDEDHDSDVESRLYAEIHYTNSIIGEENNLTNSVNNNRVIRDDTTTYSNDSKSNACNSQRGIQNNDQNMSSNMQNGFNIVSGKSSTSLETLNTYQEGNRDKQNDNERNISSKASLKRPPKISSEVNKSNKKRRTNDNLNNANNLTNASNPKGNQNTIINPFNKNALKSSQPCMQLLSPEFLSIFFGKKKNKFDRSAQKKKNKFNTRNPQTLERNDLNVPLNKNNLSQSNIISKNLAESETQQKDLLQEPTEYTVQQNVEERIENNLNNLDDAEDIIVLSSESSNDSIEDNSKYNTTLATDKKLKKNESAVDDVNSEGSTSESEESIFEVPVPPKPAPPMIELKDSDSKSSSESEDETDSDNSLDNSLISQVSSTQNNRQKSLNSNISTTEIYNIDSEDDEPVSLILNCTEVQKGVSSLSEIKRLNNQSSNSKECVEKSNDKMQGILTEKESSRDVNVLSTQHLQIQNVETNVINKKIVNTLNNEQNKSCSNPNKRNIPDGEYFFQPMTDKMKSFYNDSWGGENFDMTKLKSKMSKDPNKWAILNDDLVLSFSKRKRYFGMVCNRCNKDGHKQNECPQPPKSPICHMCGVPGHYETRCPHKKCLTCGVRQTMYRKTCERCQKMTCTRCDSRGHTSNSCPDLWRRYHHTINSIDVVPPSNPRNVMKPYYELNCCNCGKKGHDSDSCRKLRWSQHFPNPSCVTSYHGPPYHDENFDVSENMNQIQKDSLNLDVAYDRSSNFSTSSNSRLHEISQEFNKNNRNRNVQMRKDFSESRKKIIFDITTQFSEHQNIKDHKRLKKFTLTLDTPTNYFSNDYESWKELAMFLKSLVGFVKARFLLEQNNREIQMRVTCTHKYIELLTLLIKQYASRNKFQRAQMYLNCERDANKILNHLAQKKEETSEFNEDPIQLYDKIRQSEAQLMNSEAISDPNNFVKFEQLMSDQKKLLMALYKEGCADESLKKLRKLRDKTIKKALFVKQSKNMKRNNVCNFSTVTLPVITIKCLFEYLYYYNNIYSPHEPKNLLVFIEKYKKNIDLRNKLMNNPVVFPNICSQDEEVVSRSDTALSSSEQAVNVNESSQILPSSSSSNPSVTSEIPPLLKLPDNSFRTRSSYNNSISLSNHSVTSEIPPLLKLSDIRRRRSKSNNSFLLPNPSVTSEMPPLLQLPDNSIRTTSSYDNSISLSNHSVTSEIPSLLQLPGNNKRTRSSHDNSISLSNHSVTSEIPSLLQLPGNSKRTRSSHDNSISLSNPPNSKPENKVFSSAFHELFQKDLKRQEYKKAKRERRKSNDKRLNGIYLDSIRCKNNNRKLRLQSKFNKFINDTKKLLAQASKLNAPHLQSHIDTLRNKMKDVIYVRAIDVIELKKLVKQEMKRHQENWS